jgi:phosphate starvation-inducible protein PhoH
VIFKDVFVHSIIYAVSTNAGNMENLRQVSTYTAYIINSYSYILLVLYLNTTAEVATMSKGEFDLSRARGTKAQKRMQPQHQFDNHYENTIDFKTATKPQQRHINLRPKSPAQEHLIVTLLDPSVNIAVAVGPAGTGKSYLAVLAALRALRTGACHRIILTRPAVEVDEEKHGFLPGDLNKKMEPWTRPLLDIMKEFYQPREIVKMVEDEIIEISPLAFMRGRTFKNAWIVADEMQNATPNQMKMLLTRIGENSKIVVTGDIEQTDRKRADNGLIDLCERLKRSGFAGLELCELGSRDVQRHPIITNVLKMYGD